MNARRFKVTIDELRLHGFDPHSGAGISAAVERELREVWGSQSWSAPVSTAVGEKVAAGVTASARRTRGA